MVNKAEYCKIAKSVKKIYFSTLRNKKGLLTKTVKSAFQLQ